MQLSHTRPVAAARFDDPNLVSAAGLVPVVALAERSGLLTLADEHLSVPTDKGANAGRKIGSLVAGMVAGADSIVHSDTGSEKSGPAGQHAVGRLGHDCRDYGSRRAAGGGGIEKITVDSTPDYWRLWFYLLESAGLTAAG